MGEFGRRYKVVIELEADTWDDLLKAAAGASARLSHRSEMERHVGYDFVASDYWQYGIEMKHDASMNHERYMAEIKARYPTKAQT